MPDTHSGTVIDLFCGCGGLALGAAMAGFRSLAAVDIDPTLQSGFRKNFPGTKVIEASVAEIGPADWRQIIGRERPDAVIGGPPCQGFSLIGKRRLDDPRNSLIYHFYRQVSILKPKFFIMENVEGLISGQSLEILQQALELVAPSYRIVGPLVINAANFGAATNRRRVVVVGYDPSVVDPISEDVIRERRQDRLATVRDAIFDLPEPVSPTGDSSEFEWTAYPARSLSRLSTYARLLRSTPPAGLGWTKSVEQHAAGFITGLLETRHSGEVARRYAVVPGGKTDRITKSFRLQWEGQSPTLRAGTGSDKGAFQAVRPLHPGKARVITVREAARLQGFPDWFIFHPTKWHSFRMIGNSVSPHVSHGLFDIVAPKMGLALAQ